MSNMNMPFGTNSMPTGTQPFGWPMTFPNGNAQPQQIPTAAIVTNKIIVDSIEDVRNYYIAPGGDCIFLHKTEPLLFSKAVDNKGTVTIKTYDIVEHVENSDYVSKQEFKSLQEQLAELKKLLTKSDSTKEG